MLVLTRKREETLHIGNEVTVTALKIKGNSVQLGIEAPRHVRVLRGELTASTPVTSADDQREQATETAAHPADPSPRLPENRHAGDKPASGNRLRQLASRVKKDGSVPTLLQLV